MRKVIAGEALRDTVTLRLRLLPILDLQFSDSPRLRAIYRAANAKRARSAETDEIERPITEIRDLGAPITILARKP